MQASTVAICLIIGVTARGWCSYTGVFSRFASQRTRMLCPDGYYNSLAECPDELRCSGDRNCSSNDVCCPNLCGSGTCVSPWIRGEITEDQSSCRNVTCTGQGRECLVYTGRTWCMCARSCEPISTNEQLVCDQNGTTYLSMCMLNKRACESGRTLIPTACRPLRGNIVDNSEEIAGPSFSSLSSSHTIVEGDTMQLTCRPAGNPIPTIHWQTPLGNLLRHGNSIPDGIGSRMIVDSRGTLTIRNVRRSDKGKYYCIAISVAGVQAVKTFHVKIQVPRNRDGSGSSSTIDCTRFPVEQAVDCQPTHGDMNSSIKRMWVYVKEDNKCDQQYFRDCPSVTNKFSTKSQCVEACVKDICSFAPDRGPCSNFVTRFAYSQEHKACVLFTYGGCDGNLNNFPDEYTCRITCGSGSHRGGVNPLPCGECRTIIPKVRCASDFIIVGVVKHFRPDRSIEKQERMYLEVEITEVLLDRSTSLNLNQRNLNHPHEARMEIKIDLDATCPCPKVYNLRNFKKRVLVSAASRRNPSGRSNDMTAIIAGTVVNGFPTLTDQGLAQKRTEHVYRVIKSFINYPGFCDTVSNLNERNG